MFRFLLPFALLLLLAQLTVTRPAGARSSFLACLAPSTPVFAPGSTSYVRLVGLGLRNNTASPTGIVLARTAAHVSDAVRCARHAGLTVCARSGGHSFIGNSLCSGVLVDVGPMRKVSVESNDIAWVQAGAVMGEVLWNVWGRGRWVGAGICPSVGAGGFVFGGGHHPYEGRLGLACDSLVDVTLVDRFGKIIVASATHRKELFWGLCGAGGGQFGIVTSFRVRTVDAQRYNRGVVFRFTWKKEYVGELMQKWVDYKEMDGDVWFRLTVNNRLGKKSGIIGVGACYDVSSEEECMERLKKAAFFNTPGRETLLMWKVKDALHLHAFFGPGGNWGKSIVTDVRKGLLEQRYTEAGFGNKRTYQSTFLKVSKHDRPDAKFWKEYTEKCAESGFKSITWTMCELNLFNSAVIKPRNNAFAYRKSDIVTHYVAGGGTPKDLKGAYNQLRSHLSKYTSGVYVNYPELELGDGYAKAYWGDNLWRLRLLKSRYDPDLFFANPQPIPPAPKKRHKWFSWSFSWQHDDD